MRRRSVCSFYSLFAFAWVVFFCSSVRGQFQAEAGSEPTSSAPSASSGDDTDRDLAQPPPAQGGRAAQQEKEKEEEKEVETIVIVGSHSGRNRTVTESPVAIDVIDIDQVVRDFGQVDINEMLQFIAPSFNANRQSGADGADHIDPATIRGLGPDQTLVLINGKRRHQSSLINIFGCRGRGNTGTDLNAIPLAAIERIEILRDGASALYGSDAIAGVINIVLKSDVDQFTGNINGGVHWAKPSSKYAVLRDKTLDGEMFQLNGNYGFKVAEKGFVNLTVDYLTKARTNRPTDPDVFDIYRRQFGDAALDNFGTFVNAEIPLSDTSQLYASGGYNYRRTDAFAWTRHPDDEERNVPAIYPNGFDPHITSRITDVSVSGGWRTKIGSWNADFHNTFGLNRFHYFIAGTLNASLLEKSPTRFDAGGHQLGQNTTGIHLTRYFPVFENINVALGGEYRIDNYQIFAGEEGSYRNYGIVEQVENGRVVQVDALGRPAGSQGFPGYRPANEVDEYRTNLSAYMDAEFDFTSAFLVGAAVRYEKYSDFGETVNAKLASRFEFADILDIEFLDNLALRASASTGFRAPSLAQIYYNTTFTDFEGGVAIDKIIAKNNSPITRALGIPALKEETSINFSAGFTAKVSDFQATVDAYFIDIKDRIVLTGAFESEDPTIDPAITEELRALNVGAAQFFTNALDTRSYGFDVILVYGTHFGEHDLRASFYANFNWMELGDIRTSEKLRGKEDIYFGSREQKFLLASAPPMKLNLTLDYKYDFISFNVRFILYGEIELIDWGDMPDVYKAAFTLDASLGFDITDNIFLVLGGTNILNAYPQQQDTDTETGGLWDPVQMGFSGAFFFTRLGFKL